MRTLEHPSPQDFHLDTILSALADPIRRMIVCRLADGYHEQACLSFGLPVGKSTSTHHFRVLREAGIIEQRYQGTAILNSLRTADLESRFPGLLPAILASARRDTEAAAPPGGP
ncbi:transcriptional regulator [Actinoplanes lobatus]|uniref:DNA-binding transcriptional ArsR family regulator n=1 Tax=Actinoplanes lobatus TaxID=113568 RepID=A0A7W7HM35_9ACTN|nr:helix-turn-helix transcriptional regulator [Actinoplanes lobatus]MBB4753069.1 DNA-binding transcriptional ArsR family regulator [Actinoplanes lobatus]GGN87179.1 transcriptional regulator [Actinoplanes lobatus]GIE39676.1 transcriptional regulator [Actinoplanes lobatus]